MNQPEAAPQTPSSSLPFPLQDGERILGLFRRHWLYLWPYLIALLLAAIVPVGAVAWLLKEAGGFEDFGAKAFWIFAAIWLIYWLVRAALTWYRYQHDIWVVTNQRLIDSIKTQPFNLRISTADLVNVQDMSVERDGVIRTVFDYGDILCQTAGTDELDFKIAGIPHPREVQALVDRERDRERMRIRGAL